MDFDNLRKCKSFLSKDPNNFQSEKFNSIEYLMEILPKLSTNEVIFYLTWNKNNLFKVNGEI